MEQNKKIQRIYPLNSFQQAILFHSLLDKNSKAFFEQFMLQIEGELDIKLFNKSIDKLKEHCYSKNLIPMACCDVKNIISKKTLEKSGFIADHRIIFCEF